MSGWISLRWKVGAVVSLLLLTAAAIIAVTLVRYERFFLLEEGHKRVRSLAQTLAVGARDALLVRDELRLGPIVQSIMTDPDAVHAFVVDREGVVAYHSDTQLIGALLPPTGEHEAEGLLEAEVPVAVEGKLVGTATVALSTAFVDRATRATARGLLLRLALGTLLGLGGIIVLTEVHVRRIARLERAVRQLGGGDLRVKAELRGRDELSRLAHDFNNMVEELRRAGDEIKRGVTETVSALASTIEVNDAYTHGHCERVALGTKAIGERMGVEGDELREFELAALLHDIGKIGVSTHILAKRGRLTKAEFREMQEHAALGARILGAVSFLQQVARYVRHHHEDWDGGGYPDGLAGEDVPLAARIIHVVDAYDAMTSSRPYRTALPHEEAVRRIVVDRGRQFDPEVVDLLLVLVEEGLMESIRLKVGRGLAA